MIVLALCLLECQPSAGGQTRRLPRPQPTPPEPAYGSAEPSDVHAEAAERGLSIHRLRAPRTPFTAQDALALYLLLRNAIRRQTDAVRHAHMVELLMKGVVPLTDPAQIEGVLDQEDPPKRISLLMRIERACRARGDEERWRLSRQQPS